MGCNCGKKKPVEVPQPTPTITEEKPNEDGKE